MRFGFDLTGGHVLLVDVATRSVELAGGPTRRHTMTGPWLTLPPRASIVGRSPLAAIFQPPDRAAVLLEVAGVDVDSDEDIEGAAPSLPIAALRPRSGRRGRPPLPIGSHGNIRYYKTDSGWRAQTLYRGPVDG